MPVRHNRRELFTEIKVRYVPPTMCRLTFDNKREDNLREKLAEERKEKAEYAKKVGQLTMQVDWLKKKSEEVVGPDYESKFSPKPFDD